jgi:hypothetical protein
MNVLIVQKKKDFKYQGLKVCTFTMLLFLQIINKQMFYEVLLARNGVHLRFTCC